jgi:hypothetical protein
MMSMKLPKWRVESAALGKRGAKRKRCLHRNAVSGVCFVNPHEKEGTWPPAFGSRRSGLASPGGTTVPAGYTYRFAKMNAFPRTWQRQPRLLTTTE